MCNKTWPVSHNATTLGGIAAAVAAIIVTAALFMWERRRRNGFVRVGHVKALYLYPIKSCAGITLQAATPGKYGLVHGPLRDRSYMLVRGATGQALHQRMIPGMVLITPSLSADGTQLVVSSKHGGSTPPPLTLPVSTQEGGRQGNEDVVTGTVRDCNIFGGHINGIDCGEEAAQWMSEVTKKSNVRLVRYDDQHPPRYLHQQPEEIQAGIAHEKDDAAIFSDLAAYLLVSAESLADVNRRLAESGRGKCEAAVRVSERNFRPNIVIEGCPRPYDEESWSEIHIGREPPAAAVSGSGSGLVPPGTMFRNVKLCTRCVLTTVNPDTGVKDRDMEPLKTLKTYKCVSARRVKEHKMYGGDSPIFGINLAVSAAHPNSAGSHCDGDALGEVKVGDVVYAKYK